MNLQNKLHPTSRATKNVRRIIRRLRHEGFHARTDRKGNKWPRTFLAIIGWVLELRAYRRKGGRRAQLPRHVGRLTW